MGDEREEEEEEEEEDKDLSRVFLGIMEGYSDRVIPPLSELSPLHVTAIDDVIKGSSSKKRSQPEANDENETTGILKERKRREKMSELFTVLQTMVPTLFPKATRAKVVNDTIEYIQNLEKEAERLEKLKKLSGSTAATPKISHCTNRNSSVSVAVSGDVTFFGVQSLVRRRMVTEILRVFEKYNVEILAANVAVNDNLLTVTVTAFVDGNIGEGTVEKIKRDILIL